MDGTEMSLVKRIVRRLFTVFVGKQRIERWTVTLARLLQIDLVQVAYRDLGILNYETRTLSGERYLIERVLPLLVPPDEAVLFDVGANCGEVSLDFRAAFPTAKIWAFEPNPVAYSTLITNVRARDIDCRNSGLGHAAGTGVLHCYLNDQKSGHATMYRSMFSIYGESYRIEGADRLTTFEFDITTVDLICQEEGIRTIDFLKIDVEGHELSVLKGATNKIKTGQIRAIQFEFTDCNVMSRVFLRDFYEFLPKYRFYRLNANGLISLGSYATRNELFQFQNILAVREDLSSKSIESMANRE
jgi:FkbM family methyltransferase